MKTIDIILPCHLVSFMFGMKDEDLTENDIMFIETFLQTNNLGRCIRITEDSFEYIDQLYNTKQDCYIYSFKVIET